MRSLKNTMTAEQIERIKGMIGTASMQQIARATGISYYTVWCVKEGYYDQKQTKGKRLPSKSTTFNWQCYPKGVI
jgi:hypothetical protein